MSILGGGKGGLNDIVASLTPGEGLATALEGN